MIQVFKTDEQYVKWLNGQTLPSGIVVYVSDDETMYFSTNNIKGELKTYKCEKEEVIDPSEPTDPSDPSEPTKYPPLIYSAKSAGSTITVNGETVTLEQGDNIVLDYPNEITSVSATNNTALTYIQIPNTVTSLSEGSSSLNGGALYNCSSLVSITIPNSVRSIGTGTFADCSSLVSITIPNGVTSIGSYVFNRCEKLTDFNYNGTMQQFKAITLDSRWKKNAPFTVVHCTDGDVTL